MKESMHVEAASSGVRETGYRVRRVRAAVSNASNVPAPLNVPDQGERPAAAVGTAVFILIRAAICTLLAVTTMQSGEYEAWSSYLLFALAAFNLTLGIGLLQLKNWARFSVIGYFGVDIFLSILAIADAGSRMLILTVAIEAKCILSLLREDVAARFR